MCNVCASLPIATVRACLLVALLPITTALSALLVAVPTFKSYRSLFFNAVADLPITTALFADEAASLPIAIASVPVAPLLSSLVPPLELTEKYLIFFFVWNFKVLPSVPTRSTSMVSVSWKVTVSSPFTKASVLPAFGLPFSSTSRNFHFVISFTRLGLRSKFQTVLLGSCGSG